MIEENNKMRALVDTLNDYAYRYYVLDNPSVADNVYDKLYDELVALEKSTGIVLPDSPTKRVGGEPIKSFSTHTHVERLYSLDKCQSFEELRAWDAKIKATVGEVDYTLEYKLDGLTLVVTYENGLFVRATTRGNGVEGEDVTAQALTIKSIPTRIPFEGVVEAKGECIMRRSAFFAYNEKAVEPLKNPRNAAAGAIRNLDPKVTASRNLDLIFYDVNHISTNEVLSQGNGVNWLKNNKFKVEKLIVTSDIERIIDTISHVNRDELDFDIDGMVIKINDYSVREKLGYTDKFPRWAIAYKFEAEETTTTVENVVWQVGRTGKLTPLALLSPVELCGATVKKATLNNYSDILRKKIRIGSTVFIRRSNDVIPEILAAVDGTGESEIPLPETCPYCGSELVESGAHIFCPNEENCRPQIVARLAHFASKDCMDIDGLSEKTLELFYDKLGVRSADQLYVLTREDLLELDSFQDKKADNIISAINARRRVRLASFINALGIRSVGKKLASDLSEIFGSVEALSQATVEELIPIDDIGEIVAKDIRNFFETKSDYVRKLLQFVTPYVPERKTEGAFKNECVVLTGTLSMPRSRAAELITGAGGKVLSSVTKETTLVIAGDSAGSKLEKAKKAGIKIIGEAEFLARINA